MEKETTKLLKENQKTLKDDCAGSFSKFCGSVSALVQGPREFWMINGILLLHGFLYYSIVIILPLFLSEEFGYSDTLAGIVYGGMGAAYTLCAIILGTSIDKLGIRTIETFSSIALCAGATCLAFAYNQVLMLFAILMFLPLGGSVGVPAGKIAVRRYTKPETRSMAFSIVYMVMNIAAMAGFASDDILTHESQNNSFSSYRQIILISAVIIAIAVFLSVFLRNIDYENSGEAEVARGTSQGHWQIVKDLIVTKGFWQYVLLVCMAIGIRIVYRSLDATLPKFMERTIGQDAYYGTILMLNPLAILAFTPLLTPLVYYFDNYTLITIGGFISSASCMIMLLPQSYTTCVAFSIVLGIGESIWTPRFYEYSIAVAPKGKEGTYMALTSAPLFFASMIAGTMSGALLEGFCPEEGSHARCWMVWLVITSVAITSPILLLLFRKYIEQPVYDEVVAKEEAVEKIE